MARSLLTLEIAADLRGIGLEGPVWDGPTNRMYWVDQPTEWLRSTDPAWDDSTDNLRWLADGSNLNSIDVQSRDVSRVAIGRRMLGSLAVRNDGSYLVTSGAAIWSVSQSGDMVRLAGVSGHDPTTFLNDGKCDSHGRFWTGTNVRKRSGSDKGAIYRLDPPLHQLVRVAENIQGSNGLGWSPDESVLYWVDTSTRSIESFDFDSTTGSISNRRRFATLAENEGVADGLCVDTKGFVWLAAMNAGAIYRYAPSGELVDRLTVPMVRVSSLAFGGSELRDLYITSMLPQHTDSIEPLDGRLVVARGEAQGQPFHRYAG